MIEALAFQGVLPILRMAEYAEAAFQEQTDSQIPLLSRNEMKKVILANILWLFVFSNTATAVASGTTGSSYTMALHELHPFARSWFNTGAGQGYDGVLYDNKKAQTFVPICSGFIQNISVAAYRMSDTTAPLRIRVTDTLNGVPTTTLAEVYIDSSEVPTSFYGARPYLNVIANFSFTTLLLEEGKQYGLVLDSSIPEANYRIHGSYEYTYPDGVRFDSQNANVWAMQSSGDLFFHVLARPHPIIRALNLETNGLVSMSWTNSCGNIWIDQSSNLIDWKTLAGPITNASAWSGTIDKSHQSYFRLHQTQ